MTFHVRKIPPKKDSSIKSLCDFRDSLESERKESGVVVVGGGTLLFYSMCDR